MSILLSMSSHSLVYKIVVLNSHRYNPPIAMMTIVSEETVEVQPSFNFV